jgi:hypothetical protein
LQTLKPLFNKKMWKKTLFQWQQILSRDINLRYKVFDMLIDMVI